MELQLINNLPSRLVNSLFKLNSDLDPQYYLQPQLAQQRKLKLLQYEMFQQRKLLILIKRKHIKKKRIEENMLALAKKKKDEELEMERQIIKRNNSKNILIKLQDISSNSKNYGYKYL